MKMALDSHSNRHHHRFIMVLWSRTSLKSHTALPCGRLYAFASTVMPAAGADEGQTKAIIVRPNQESPPG
jgi:hypothetical protein